MTQPVQHASGAAIAAASGAAAPIDQTPHTSTETTRPPAADRQAGPTGPTETHPLRTALAGRDDGDNPTTPVGRAYAGPKDAARVYCALKTASFAVRSPFSPKEQRAAMRDPDYCPDLDLVAVAPSGELAALVVGGLDREESARRGEIVGYTDPIATRPRYRRLGLARALLHEAFVRLRARGAVEARVGTGSWNTATQRLLESVGYQRSHRLLVYGMQLTPGGIPPPGSTPPGHGGSR